MLNSENNEDLDKKVFDLELPIPKRADYWTSNKTYTDNFSFSDSPSYSAPINYFHFKDNYEAFRNSTITHVAPFINVTRINLGQGLYGVCFPGLREIYLNENNTDNGEVKYHEHKHLSNPDLSEKEVRDLVRIQEENTRYH